MTSGCQMLHFTGHGEAESLVFESERQCGKAETMEILHLGDLISAGGTVPDLVFLESCDLEMCGQFVTPAGVPHMILAKSDMPGGTTRDFAATFYNELITNNFTVQRAFDIAVSNVTTIAATFLLLPKHVSHDVQLLNDLPEGDFIDETPPLPQYFNLPPVEKACTERVELRKLLNLLEDKHTNCVTITGERGIGKTEMALQACHYMGERNQFGAIFFAACREATEHSCPFPIPERPEAHIQRLCQLVGLALHESHISCLKDLVEYLKSKSGRQPDEPTYQENPSRKILVVLDAVNALIEGGGIEARKSLAGFVDQLCCNMSNLKLLITSERGLLEWTDRCLSNSSEKAVALNCIVVHNPEVKNIATSSPSQDQVTPRERFYKRAEEISQAKILDKNCRNTWLRAIWKATEHGLTKSHDDDACYRHVPWSYLSSALKEVLREVQSAFNEDRSQSEGSPGNSRVLGAFHSQSSENESSSSFSARDLNEGELDFIRNLLRNSLKRDGNDTDRSKCGADSWDGRISTGYGYPGKDDGHEWFSLEAFSRFSRKWMGPVIATLSKMQREWAANDPVKVHGFVSKHTAKNLLLKTNQSGVFMLGFSVPDPGRLFLVVTRKASRRTSTGDSRCTPYIKNYHVTVREDGKWSVGEGPLSTTFNSLHDMVYKKHSLETLYPNIPKENAFPVTSPTASSNIWLAAVEE